MAASLGICAEDRDHPKSRRDSPTKPCLEMKDEEEEEDEDEDEEEEEEMCRDRLKRAASSAS